ncbi:MAG: NAD-dependent epimerase/dehydratase family protein [Spartobacteria bacterium]|nr:NAD-dependent epimerase/dehydratase family protein [Spartobacteria bacterium]
MKILVTGANGFVGQSVCWELMRRGHEVRGALRKSGALPDGCKSVVVGNIDGKTDWGEALADVDVVVHLAARVHVMNEVVSDPLEAFRSVNVGGTRGLAEAAAKAGVTRFVFMSSIKVNGEETGGGGRKSEGGVSRPDIG